MDTPSTLKNASSENAVKAKQSIAGKHRDPGPEPNDGASRIKTGFGVYYSISIYGV